MAKRDTQGATPVQGADVFEILAKAAGKSKDKLTVQDIAAVGSKVGFSSKDIKRAQEGFSNAGKGFSFKLSQDGSSFDTVDDKGQLVTEVSKQAGSRKGLQVKDLISPKSKSLNYLAGLASAASQGMSQAEKAAEAEAKKKDDILAKTKSFGTGLQHAHNNPAVDTGASPKTKGGTSTTGNGIKSTNVVPDLLKAPSNIDNTQQYTLQEAMKKTGVKGKTYTPDDKTRIINEFNKYYNSTDLSLLDRAVSGFFEGDISPERGVTSKVFGPSDRYYELLPEIEKDLRRGVNIPSDKQGLIKYFNDVDRRVVNVKGDPGALSFMAGPAKVVGPLTQSSLQIAKAPVVQTAANAIKGTSNSVKEGVKSAANSLLKKGKDLFKGSKQSIPAKPSGNITGKVKTTNPPIQAPQSYLPPSTPLKNTAQIIKNKTVAAPRTKTISNIERKKTIKEMSERMAEGFAKGGKLPMAGNGRILVAPKSNDKFKKVALSLQTPDYLDKEIADEAPISEARKAQIRAAATPSIESTSKEGKRNISGGGDTKTSSKVNPSDATHLAGIVAPKLLANQISKNAYKKIKNVNSVLPNLSVPVEFEPRRSNQPARFRQQLSNDAQLFTASREFDNAQRNQIRAQENAQIEESLMNQRVRNVGIKNQNENIIAGMKTRDNYTNQQIDSQKILGRASDKMSLLSDAGADVQDFYAQGRQLKAVQSSDAFQTMIRQGVPYEEAYEKAYGKKVMKKGGKISAKNIMSKC